MTGQMATWFQVNCILPIKAPMDEPNRDEDLGRSLDGAFLGQGKEEVRCLGSEPLDQ